MRPETLEQILKVIELAARRYSIGGGIDRPYQYGVKRVSEEYGIAYQTVGDACRRRLGLDDIAQFKIMLKTCLEGDPIQLRDLLLRKNSHYHDKINAFFIRFKNDGNAQKIKEENPDTFISYNVQLRKNDSDVLRALAQILNGEPEKIFVDVAMEAIKDRMRKVVSQL